MEPISTKDILPENGKYVLAHYTGGNWHDEDDQAGCEWVVAKFVRGISGEERSALCDGDARKHEYHSGDAVGNNRVPYWWEEFGPRMLFGQEVNYWMPLPDLEKRKSK